MSELALVYISVTINLLSLREILASRLPADSLNLLVAGPGTLNYTRNWKLELSFKIL